jgi:hypothetical protein
MVKAGPPRPSAAPPNNPNAPKRGAPDPLGLR